LQVRFDLEVTRGDLAMGALVQLHGLPQGEQVLGPPVALQRPGDLGFTMLTMAVAQLGQRGWVPFASQDRLENRHASHPRDVADHVLQFEVHLRQRLLHMLEVLPGRGDQHGALAQVAAQHADLLRGPKGGRQQPVGVQALQPLAVLHVTLGPTRRALHFPCIDEHHPKAPRFK
jgi:hypothetical protein